MSNSENATEVGSIADERRFLAACGKFAMITPPRIIVLLSTSLTSNALWSSHRGKINGGPSAEQQTGHQLRGF